MGGAKWGPIGPNEVNETQHKTSSGNYVLKTGVLSFDAFVVLLGCFRGARVPIICVCYTSPDHIHFDDHCFWIL